MNVLNVLEPPKRREVSLDILSKLNEGGKAIIGTRGWRGDIANTKVFREADESGAIWVKGKDGEGYQKGFDGNELVEYFEELAGEGYKVTKKTGIAKNAVVVEKISAPSSPFKKETGIPNIDDIEGDPEYFAKNKNKVLVDKEMTPDEYIKEASEGFGTPVDKLMKSRDRSLIDKYKQDMENGDIFPALSINKSGETFSQEGLHRAQAAKELGIQTLPVRVVEPADGVIKYSKLPPKKIPVEPSVRTTDTTGWGSSGDDLLMKLLKDFD